MSVMLWLAVVAAGLAAQPSRDRTLEALRGEDPAAKREALQQIATSGNPEPAGAVAALAADPDDEIQLLAIGTLLDLLMPAPGAAGRREPGRGGAGAAHRAFETAGEPARPVPASAFAPLAEAMNDATSEVAREAAYAFAVLASSRQGIVPEAALTTAQGALQRMVASSEAATRLAAIAVVGRVFRASLSGPPPTRSSLPEELLDELIAAMNREDPREQGAAMEALGRAREGRARAALEDRFAFHRAQGPTALAVVALDALARLADSSTTEMVRTLATDPWARNGDPYLAVLFARERLLNDGSTATLKEAARNRRFAERARAYLAELGVTP